MATLKTSLLHHKENRIKLFVQEHQRSSTWRHWLESKGDKSKIAASWNTADRSRRWSRKNDCNCS